MLALALMLAGTGALADIMQVVNCKEWVSLREEPSTSSDWIVRVPLGDVVDALNYEGDFMFCTYHGESGYILAANLSSNVSPVGAGAQEGSYRKIVNCNSCVTLRREPSTSAYELDSVPLGAVVQAYDEVGSFTRCFYDGMTGYILTEYLGPANARQIRHNS